MLTSKQRSYLSKLAASLNPTVMLGKEGASEAVAQALKAEFSHRELVKLRFVSSKDERDDLAAALAASSNAELVRTIGNVAIFYKQANDPEKRTIQLPK
ncbi:ribosome assembly RNA-binding protein YhbY [Treponema sp.]